MNPLAVVWRIVSNACGILALSNIVARTGEDLVAWGSFAENVLERYRMVLDVVIPFHVHPLIVDYTVIGLLLTSAMFTEILTHRHGEEVRKKIHESKETWVSGIKSVASEPLHYRPFYYALHISTLLAVFALIAAWFTFLWPARLIDHIRFSVRLYRERKTLEPGETLEYQRSFVELQWFMIFVAGSALLLTLSSYLS